MKVVLTGPISFANSQELVDPDIRYSLVDGVMCQKNKLSIRPIHSGLFLVYHMYDSTEMAYSGRWYNTHFRQFDEVDPATRRATFICPEFEVFNTARTKTNVRIDICFTEKGWDCLSSVLKLQ